MIKWLLIALCIFIFIMFIGKIGTWIKGFSLGSLFGISGSKNPLNSLNPLDVLNNLTGNNSGSSDGYEDNNKTSTSSQTSDNAGGVVTLVDNVVNSASLGTLDVVTVAGIPIVVPRFPLW